MNVVKITRCVEGGEVMHVISNLLSKDIQDVCNKHHVYLKGTIHKVSDGTQIDCYILSPASASSLPDERILNVIHDTAEGR